MLLWLVCTYLSLVTASLDDVQVDEGPYKVFRIVPTTAFQLKKLIALFESAKGDDADFWHAPSVVNSTVDVMISPSFTEKFTNFLKQHDYPFHIAIEDLKKLLIEKEGPIKMNVKGVPMKDLVRLHDDTGAFVSRLRMGEYYPYSVIVAWMKKIADSIPETARVVDIGTSSEGRSITGLQ
ncbi:carboxypeptidase activation peptide, partial [Oesophagostomum dentatum]